MMNDDERVKAGRTGRNGYAVITQVFGQMGEFRSRHEPGTLVVAYGELNFIASHQDAVLVSILARSIITGLSSTVRWPWGDLRLNLSQQR